MSRAERLLQLMQVLRRHRAPVAGSRLAGELGISLRTLYRDIASLQTQGAHIEGEPGLGYVLKPGFLLPPLMFSEEELEALLLGAGWVADRGDERLQQAARDSVAKLAAVLPPELRTTLEQAALWVGPGEPLVPSQVEVAVLRAAIRSERKLSLLYRDLSGRRSERVVWPLALAFFDRVRVLVAWCELRQAFRHFRTDRMETVQVLAMRYPQRRAQLVRQWRLEEGVPANET